MCRKFSYYSLLWYYTGWVSISMIVNTCTCQGKAITCWDTSKVWRHDCITFLDWRRLKLFECSNCNSLFVVHLGFKLQFIILLVDRTRWGSSSPVKICILSPSLHLWQQLLVLLSYLLIIISCSSAARIKDFVEDVITHP